MALKKTGEKIKIDKNGQVSEIHQYEKIQKVKVIVNKEVLQKRKANLEEELAQVNLDLAQIADDEKNDVD